MKQLSNWEYIRSVLRCCQFMTEDEIRDFFQGKLNIIMKDKYNIELVKNENI